VLNFYVFIHTLVNIKKHSGSGGIYYQNGTVIRSFSTHPSSVLYHWMDVIHVYNGTVSGDICHDQFDDKCMCLFSAR
jgi:hypothetical protein